MREDIKKYSDNAYQMICDVTESIGGRLAGSDEETKIAGVLSDKMKGLGLKPVTEKFMVSPRASIGGIPYIGWVGLIALALMYFAPLSIVSFALCLGVWVFLVIQVFLYRGWFDSLFKQKMSRNVYASLTPQDEKYDYTIMLGAHMDTSWNWKMSAKNPNTVVLKMVWGVVGMLFVTACSIAYFSLWIASLKGFDLPIQQVNFENFGIALKVVSLFFAPGLYFITQWCDGSKENASPGAMDNTSGLAINFEIMNYFKENPDKMPKNARIINMGFGSEEAGLKGAFDFVKRHKGEEILENLYMINVDSIADKDYFEAITGDTWQFTKFTPELIQMLVESLKEAGVESPGQIKNPVGGCDSTPFIKAGIKTVTFAAQNPVITQYYHTVNDVAERFDAEVINTGMDAILRVCEKIEKANTK